ncbi:uncharacterized protein Tco025E_06805 [Trypanosoma conorhini]|uniref:Uncharacterized protein n=1 Tax=Trypanosoma conorhini TaxID=83891 RepID=A0A422NXY1_9TRYP|nr:uncharacterized protein Tco025E_06805 [Trypanosoma conorhini]RNF10316.1 hypothetical protein Tco025E_06805 [Trypanosoma conorhini]
MLEGEDQAAVSERSALLRMLQRITDSEKLCAAAEPPVQGLITAWMSGALGRVQAMMRSAAAEYQKQGEPFERQAATMVFFHRLSLLVEVLLRVLESTPAASAAAGTLLQELRDTVTACHTPWVQLLRREWENGLCTAYREALAAVAAPAARGYALEYAACWRHAPRPSQPPRPRSRGQAEEAVAYPIQLTPHIAELLFTLQHILHTVSVGRRLRGTVFPLVVRELLDGTTAAALNFVLPTLTSARAHGSGGVGGEGAGNAHPLRPPPTTDDGRDGGNRDEAAAAAAADDRRQGGGAASAVL